MGKLFDEFCLDLLSFQRYRLLYTFIGSTLHTVQWETYQNSTIFFLLRIGFQVSQRFGKDVNHSFFSFFSSF